LRGAGAVGDALESGRFLFGENARESAGISGTNNNLRASKTVRAQQISGNTGYHREHLTPNPLVAGSSPARPTSETIFQDQIFRLIVYVRRLGIAVGLVT
jgi:hypothetical protein